MAEMAPIFEKVYQDYMRAVADLDLASRAAMLGGEMDGPRMKIPVFGQIYSISGDGVEDPDGERPDHCTSVVLAKYVLTCPEREPADASWVAYKDFKDAMPYAEGFKNTALKPIAEFFGGRMELLKKASALLGARPLDMEISCDYSARFAGLPKIPMAFVMYDRDEDFPAGCSILFERRVADYLDMECIALMGWLLKIHLVRQAKLL